MDRHKIFKVMTVILAVIVLCLAGYIMWHRLGLNPDYDFGAGAYYYADDPAIQDLADKATFLQLFRNGYIMPCFLSGEP